MNDYISREALIRKLDSIPALCKHPNLQALCEEWARSIPAADVVEVVRCRECKYGDWYTAADGRRLCYCLQMAVCGKTEADFCSYGEREDGGAGGDKKGM